MRTFDRVELQLGASERIIWLAMPPTFSWRW